MTITDIARTTDEYFNKTRRIVERHGDRIATYAVFLRAPSMLAPDKAFAFLRAHYAHPTIPLTILSPHAEGTVVPTAQPLFFYTGALSALVTLETGLLQRIGLPCLAALSAYEQCMALPTVAFIDMHARHGYGADMNDLAAYGASVGSRQAREKGAKGFVGSSQAQTMAYYVPGATTETRGLGTMPHALIGYAKTLDPAHATLKAAQLYAETFPDETTVTVLNDFDGREVSDALSVADWFFNQARLHEQGKTLAMRIDTHGGRSIEGLDWDRSRTLLMDWIGARSEDEVLWRALKNVLDGTSYRSLEHLNIDAIKAKFLFDTGVTAANPLWLRKRLDQAGFRDVKIVVSSGFNPLKCRIFGALRIPVDMVGTGSFLPEKMSESFATADIIRYGALDGSEAHDFVKVGREFLGVEYARHYG